MKVLLADKIHLYNVKCCLTGNRLKSEVHFHSCIQARKHVQQPLTRINLFSHRLLLNRVKENG